MTTQPSPRDVQVLFRNVEPQLERIARECHAHWRHIPYEEFFSVGKTEIIALAHQYDPRRGSFGAFVYRRVAGAMQDFALRQTREIDRDEKALHDGWRRENVPGDPLDRMPSMEEMMEETPEDVKKRSAREQRLRVQRMAALLMMRTDAPIDPEATCLEREEVAHAVDTMNRILATFTPVQRAAFRSFQMDDGTQDQIAEQLQISKMSVRRYVEKVEDALKAGLIAAGIESPESVRRAWFILKGTSEEGST